jgi:hypothetical protein
MTPFGVVDDGYIEEVAQFEQPADAVDNWMFAPVRED